MEKSKVERFTINVPDETLADLRERLARTRYPEEIENSAWEYGANLAYLKELIEYWRVHYDWRMHERELNRFEHFRTEIDGLKIHFIHQRGRGPAPKPLLLVHGWPGSIYEFDQIIPMLTAPEAHGGAAEESFTVIAPSIPGYGFSDRPNKPGMKIEAIAEIFFWLMTETLGYERFGAQGGDWGSMIVSRLGFDHAPHLYGIHLNMLGVGPPDDKRAGTPTEEEAKFLASAKWFRHEEAGYQAIQGTKPQTLAYGLNDSPAGLAAWIIEKFRTWSDCGGDVEKRFSKDQLLTNIMIYWVTQTINSSTRLYYEYRHHPWRLQHGERIEAPTAVAVFPHEILRPPLSWAQRAYNIRRWTTMPAGGHFAAMEEPSVLANDIRAFFRELK